MNRRPGFWQFLKEDVIGTENRFILISWFVAVVGVVVLGLYLNHETITFLGIADSRESQVNFEYAVEIENVHVLPGQTVNKGDLLVEVNHSEVNTRLMELASLKEKLEAEQKVRKQLASVFQDGRKNSMVDPLDVEINTINKDIEYLEQKKKNLFIFAEVSGVVGAVNFKKGEKASPFSPILTISPVNPSYIHGYVHESIHSRLQVGQILKVSSVTGTVKTQGQIVSIASRITPFPERLLRVPTLLSWGREVIIEIPEGNGLLLGEKVQIQPTTLSIGFSSALAEEKEDKIKKPTIETLKDIVLPKYFSDHITFEPSGLVYMSDLKKYLVITDEDSRLIMMDTDGLVQDQVIQVKNLPEIDDLESISESDNAIYLMSSQTRTKKGKQKLPRQQFVKVQRQGLEFTAQASVEFKPLLLKAMSKSTDSRLRALAQRIDDSDTKRDDLEVEAHAVVNNNLYIGLKKPVEKDNEILFLEIKGVSELLSKKEIKPSDVSILLSIKIPHQKEHHSITDLVMKDKRIYFSTTCPDEKCSAVWQYNLSGVNPELILLKMFDSGKLEGLSIDTNAKMLTGVFDRDGKNTQFVKIATAESKQKEK